MKKILFALLFLPSLAFAQPQTCAVTGTFYNFDGSKADSIEVRIVQVFDSSGALIHSKPISYKTGGAKSGSDLGVVRFNIIRNSVAYIYARAMNWDSYGSFGRPVAIPNTASGDLASFVTPDSVPTSSIVLIPVLSLIDSASGLTYRADSLRLGSGATVVAPTNGGDTPTLIVQATGGVSIADVSATLDSGAVRSEKDPTVTDSLDTIVRVEKDPTVSDSLDTVVRTETDPQAPAIVSDSLGTVVRTESDPSAISKASTVADSLATNGARSISSTGRIFSVQDSVTLTVAPNETINLANGNNFRLTLTANDTLAFTGGIDGQVFQVVVTNVNNFTLAWSGVAWPAGAAPTLTAVQNKRSIFSFIQSGSMIHGVSVLNY